MVLARYRGQPPESTPFFRVRPRPRPPWFSGETFFEEGPRLTGATGWRDMGCRRGGSPGFGRPKPACGRRGCGLRPGRTGSGPARAADAGQHFGVRGCAVSLMPPSMRAISSTRAPSSSSSMRWCRAISVLLTNEYRCRRPRPAAGGTHSTGDVRPVRAAAARPATAPPTPLSTSSKISGYARAARLGDDRQREMRDTRAGSDLAAAAAHAGVAGHRIRPARYHADGAAAASVGSNLPPGMAKVCIAWVTCLPRSLAILRRAGELGGGARIAPAPPAPARSASMSAAACNAESSAQVAAQRAQPVGFGAELARSLEHRASGELRSASGGSRSTRLDVVVQVGHGLANGDAGRLELALMPCRPVSCRTRWMW